MKTLLLESLPGCGAETTQALVAAGHQVSGCRTPGAAPFPCVGLTSDCPLDEPEGVDVVVVVRSPTEPDPTISEAGVNCALRRGVPVLMMGEGAVDPFAGYVHECPPDTDPAQACADAVRSAAEKRAEPLRLEAVRLLEGFGHDATGTQVEVIRTGSESRIVAVLPSSVPTELDGTIATKLLAIDQERPSPGHVIDVSVTRRSASD